MKQKKWIFSKVFILVLVSLMISCSTIQKGIDQISKISDEDKKALIETGKTLRSTFADISEEEEYYIGRAVAALILTQYKAYNNNVLNNYVNQIGHAVVLYSDRPEIYAGYHFLILDSDEVNALAAPSGFIFITKGLLKRCRNEEMLASILAHEVGHVAAKHGLQSIKKSRLIEAFQLIGTKAVQRYGSEELAKLTSVFENVLGDIVEKLIERGYDRKFEYEADQLSVETAVRTGYDPNGLMDFLETMAKDSEGQADKGWFKTHPSAKDRLKKVDKNINSLKSIPQKEKIRTQRFERAMKSLK
jgi:predicted Zn-dependent protease